MDFSIYDAKEAGFDKVVFIIRKDIEEEFRSVIGNRIGDQIEVEYVYQDLADIPAGFEVPEGRTKPWGTGQAVLCCKDVVKEPFMRRLESVSRLTGYTATAKRFRNGSHQILMYP